MKCLPKLLALIFISLATLTAATTHEGDDELVKYGITDSNFTTEQCCDWGPSEIHHGVGTIEVWVARSAVNAGDLHGIEMNKAVWDMLGPQCPPDVQSCSSPFGRGFRVPYVSKSNPFPIDTKMTWLGMAVRGAKWENEYIRQLLINSVSATMMGLTDDARNNPNCYEVPGVMFCNVATKIRVNLPDLDGRKDGAHKNYMFVDLSGENVHGHMACCETRTKADKQLDLLGNRASRIFKENFTRSVMCMVGGWTTCEDCCKRFNCNDCKRCGHKCKKLD